MNWHGTIVLLQWLILVAGVFVLVRRGGWSAGARLMAGALGFQAVGGLMSAAAADEINQHQAFWIPMLAWSVSVLGFAIGFLLLCIKRREPIQPPQHNAGNRPSSEDSPASETSSSLGPRG